ncbi:hypothetical protein [uncultured Streptococcus sp.]|uniref:hypothetical protein n=1 Tax=uncultured Streptococcus sp. TaxID=83427 RepID=UPI0025E7326E|nr:hypothetical protein [uncultured Streptococcus sp.]
MDWVTFGGIVATIASLVGIAIKLARDNSGLKAEMKALSKEREMEHDSLSKEHIALSKEHDSLSKEHASIKKDTEYISDEMKQEKMAREILYQNTTKAREILDTMDLMKEVVLQNSKLTQEVTRLKVENFDLSSSNSQLDSQLCKVYPLLRKIHGQLASLEDYCSTEEAQTLLKRVESQLSELTK